MMQYVTTCIHELYPSFICTLVYVFFLGASFSNFLLLNLFDLLFEWFFIMSANNKHFGVHFHRITLAPSLRQKMEKRRSIKEEMDREVCISHQSLHLFSIDKIIKVLFRTCTLNWRVNTNFAHQGNGIKRRNESTTFII